MQHKLWETIADEAAGESDLWAAALREPGEQEREAVFSPLGEERFALGLETIYEGYLLHYGRPRLFDAGDRDTNVLLGDYLYAHGLVRISELGDVTVVADLAELLSLCAGLRADPDAGDRLPDGELWAATVALLATGDPALATAREPLRDRRDGRRLARLAVGVAGAEAVDHALALHRRRVA